jgi:Tfp pilus assembly protein PilX
MNRNHRAPRRGLRTNRGSAIITVLVAVALVSILGTVLLYMTYTGYKMKATERQSKENFYDAEAAVNEIRTGLQLAVSKSIATANTKVLERYNAVLADNADAFQTEFSAAITTWKPNDEATGPLLGENVTVVLDNGTTYTGPYFNCTMLLDFITSTEQPYVTISSGLFTSTGMGELVIETDESDTVTAYVLKNITVTCVKNGFETNITTDVRLAVPDFTYEESNLVTTAIQDYVIIANTSLNQTAGGSLALDGNVYAGEVNIFNSGNSLTVGNASSAPYRFITPGTVTVGSSAMQGGSLTIGANTALWSDSIEVGKYGNLTLSGKTYVADDLALEGDGAAATLSGWYYGFGSSATDAGASSSILINGHNTALDLGSLDILMLAGQCFIGTGEVPTGLTGIGNSDLLTGESVSVKSNQIAYLIPPDCFTASSGLSTNPVIYPTTGTPSRSVLLGFVDTSKELWDGGPSLNDNDYNASVEVVYRALGSQTLVYFYIGFSSPEDAGNYFKDYFEHNAPMIDTYMSLYTSLSITDDPEDLLVGDALYFGPVSSNTSTMAGNYETDFDNLCTTLSPDRSGTGTVYSNVVDVSAIDALSNTTTLFTTSDGTVVGMITKADCNTNSVLSLYPDMKVIISTADVTVNQPSQTFYGLIIAGGAVNLQKSSIWTQTVSAALYATNAEGNRCWILKIGSALSVRRPTA